MNRARYLLKNTDLQIQDVAMQVGYEDGLYFSRMFHKLYGMSPRTYRFQKEE
jgi:AraC-like DNA-binding protein